MAEPAEQLALAQKAEPSVVAQAFEAAHNVDAALVDTVPAFVTHRQADELAEQALVVVRDKFQGDTELDAFAADNIPVAQAALDRLDRARGRYGPHSFALKPRT